MLMFKQFLLIFTPSILIVLLIIYFMQRSLIYFPVQDKPERSHYDALDMHEVSITTTDNIKLFSWYKPAMAKKPTILFLHGNAGHIGYRMPWIRKFLQEGYGVLLLEYRGYGGNDGAPNEEGLYMDARAGVDFLLKSTVEATNIILFGESLGSAVAIQIATEKLFCALILQSPFSSLKKVAKHHYPWMFLSPWDKFNSIEKLKDINVPLLLVHGQRDEVVPYSHARDLYAKANEPKHFLSYPDLHHNDMWNEDYYTKTRDFIINYCQ